MPNGAAYMLRMFKNNDSPVRQLGLLLVLAAIFSLSFGTFFPGTPGSTAVYAQGEDSGDDIPESQDSDDKGDGGGASQSSEQSQSYLVWFVGALGPIFAPAFAITSVLFVTLAVMNFMAISRNNIMPLEMVDRFKELLDEQDFQEAYEVAKASESPQGKILAAGLAKMSAGYEAAQQSMSDVAEEEITRLEQKLGYIALIGGIAPMLGLLGTVYGMVASFQVIATAGTAPQASELAKGISTALITTEVGLFIAIPAMIIYELFRNKLALLVLELTVQTENLMGRFNNS